MTEQHNEPLSDRRRPQVELRFLPSGGPEVRPETADRPVSSLPVAGRQAGSPPGGSRLVGRATIARLRGVPASRQPESAEPQDQPGRRPPAGDAGQIAIIYEQIRRPWVLPVFTAMLVSLTAGVVLGQTEAYRAGKARPASTVAAAQPPVAAPAMLTAPLGTAGPRNLEIAGAATVLRLRTAPLGDASYQITGFDPGIPPQITEAAGGSVLTLAPGTAVAPGAEVVLNTAVQWTVKLTGAATDLDVDARAGGLTTVASSSPISRGVLQLAKPKGSASLTITGPVGDLTIRTDAGVPVRVRVAKGAGLATIGGTTRRDVAEGATLREAGWRTATGRYDVRIAARVNTIVVERPPSKPGSAVPGPRR